MDIKIRDLALKRDDAIESVKRNLRRYAEIKRFPETIEERVKSFSSFIINVNGNEVSANNENLLMKALVNEEDDKKFEHKYDSLLSCLCPENTEYIIRIYLRNEKIVAIKDENNNIYKLLKNVYEILACLDEEIDYTLEDYSTYRSYELTKARNNSWELKKVVINYLTNFKSSNLYQEKINRAINMIPEQERYLLLRYINEDNTYTAYEYRKIKRAILLFAYFFDEIDFNKEDLRTQLKKTGGGWKRMYDQIIKKENKLQN